MSRIIEVVLDFRDRDMYDKLSMSYVKAGIFSVLIKAIVKASHMPQAEYKSVARIFELCACHS